MLYVTTTFWLLVIVLAAWGVHALWSGMLKPRTVNSILLPGTLVAQVGHVFGLLITGATVTNTTLYKDDTGAPETTKDPKPRVPVLGPVIIGMLPLLACAIAIYCLARFFGGTLFGRLTETTVDSALPATLAGFWELLRRQITLLETWTNAVSYSDWTQWQVWLFLYLLVCLTVRMAPFPGTVRGSMGAIVMVGLLLAVAGRFLPATEPALHDAWPVLSLAVTTLLFLLLASLLLCGGMRLIKTLATQK